MTATIVTNNAGIAPGFMVVYRDADGQVIERVMVSEIFVSGDPHVRFIAEDENVMRLVR